MSFTKTLSRDEMKNVTAGRAFEGNMYCDYNGHQMECDHKDTLSGCLDWCTSAWGTYCGGCARFPEVK